MNVIKRCLSLSDLFIKKAFISQKQAIANDSISLGVYTYVGVCVLATLTCTFVHTDTSSCPDTHSVLTIAAARLQSRFWPRCQVAALPRRLICAALKCKSVFIPGKAAVTRTPTFPYSLLLARIACAGVCGVGQLWVACLLFY